jgi:hypothetical protein
MALMQFQLVCNYDKWGITSDGGFFSTYTNRTGTDSVKGTIVISSANYDNAVDIAPTSSDMPIGVIYDNGVADGSPVRVIVGGRAQVLLQNTVASTRGYWCGTSSTAGRMTQQATVPSTTDHWKEIGHSMESVTGGTDKLAWVNLHFN